jgi:hypothetical protein
LEHPGRAGVEKRAPGCPLVTDEHAPRLASVALRVSNLLTSQSDSVCPVIRNSVARCADMAAVTQNAEMRKLLEDLAVKWLQLALDLEKARAILEAKKE